MKREQATRCNSKQLAYLSYWQQRGYTFGRNDVIPESTTIPPRQWYLPRRVELLATAVILFGVCSLLYITK